MTIEEIRKEIKHVKNRIRCVISDKQRDVKRVYQEHRKVVNPMIAELHHLRERVTDSAKLTIHLQLQIVEKQKELIECLSASGIKKMLKLICRVNDIKPHKHSQVGRKLASLTNERASTLRFIIAGYQNEVNSLRRLLANDMRAFRKRETELQTGVTAQCRYFEIFMQHKVRGDEILDQCYARLEELYALERNMGGEKKVQKLSAKADELLKLMLSMPPELIKLALRDKGNPLNN